MKGPHVQSLVYSMVARGEVVLAEYSAFPTASASFSALAAACLPNLRAASSSTDVTRNKMISYTCESHIFHFVLQDHLTYLVVSDDLEAGEIALAFLHRVTGDFYKRYGNATNNSDLFKAHSLDKDFGPRLKEHMQYCLDNYQSLIKRPSIREQVLQVKGIVAENIEKVVDSRENIELKVDNNEILRAHVENFHRQGRQLKQKIWRRQVKLRLLVFLVSVILILSIWVIICKGFKC